MVGTELSYRLLLVKFLVRKKQSIHDASSTGVDFNVEVCWNVKENLVIAQCKEPL